MDWRILSSTFLLIFLAELGDKTQLAALASAAGSRSTWSVFVGACLALLLSTVLAVALGSAAKLYLPVRVIQVAAGALFLLFGTLCLWQALRGSSVSIAMGHSPGLARIALRAAEQFEAAASVRYLDLAATAENATLKQLLTDLALEDRAHLSHVQALATAHGTTLLTAQRPAAVNLLPPRPQELHAADYAALQAAIAHEQATASFYEALAGATAVPSLREHLMQLGREDALHAQRLREWLAAA